VSTMRLIREVRSRTTAQVIFENVHGVTKLVGFVEVNRE